MRAIIEYAFQVSALDLSTPDVSVIRTARFLSVAGRIIKGAPEIAIEVVSPADTAYKIKRKVEAYLANGAQSVWVLFDDNSIIVHTATEMRQLRGDQPLEDALLPGFSLPVTKFFEIPA